MNYSSEFTHHRRRAIRKRVLATLAGVGIVGAFLLVSAWDEAALARGIDTSFKLLAENTYYRRTLLSDDHCHAPRAGETLIMRLADSHAPGKGFECQYWIGRSYGRAERLVEIDFSRGWSDE